MSYAARGPGLPGIDAKANGAMPPTPLRQATLHSPGGGPMSYAARAPGLPGIATQNNIARNKP